MTVAILNLGLPGLFRWPSVLPLFLIMLSLFLTACTSSSLAHAEEISLGTEVYGANCACCHGLNGEGQPHWKTIDDKGKRPAPPHDNTATRGIMQTLSSCRYLPKLAEGSSAPGSAMIGYKELLTLEEMEASLAYIKTFWEEEEREFQAQVTQQSGG